MAVFVGTSGWHYRHWSGPFYPRDLHPEDYLGFYRRRFRTVEINNSFYRLPEGKTFASWRDSVPGTFRFAVKASRFITHNKKLKDCEAPLRLFLGRAGILGNRLGPVLFQLPPNWKYDGPRLEGFLASLPRGPRYVFEFRNPDWMRDEAFGLLDRHGAGFCIHDMPGSRAPEIVVGRTAYVRFHGPDGKYRGSYPDAALKRWADKLRAWSRKRIGVYAYFNNDIRGFAPANALALTALLARNP
jgi:uncharacterized protein YecE (DUF72 family)